MPPRYQPADSLASPRFTGVRTFARLPHVQTTEDVDVAVVGLPFDTGATFKVGARFGPESVRSASHMLRPYTVELDVQVFETLSIVDYGDAPVIPGFIEDSYAAITATLRPLADASVITLASAATTVLRWPSCARWRQRMVRWRLFSSIHTAMSGIATSVGISTPTARPSAARSKKACSMLRARFSWVCAARCMARKICFDGKNQFYLAHQRLAMAL